MDIHEQKEQIPQKLEAKYAIIGAAIKAGISQPAISKGLTMPRSTVNHIARALDKKYDLTNTGMVKLAHRAIKDTLKMKPVAVEKTAINKDGDKIDYIEQVYPSHTNRLQAVNEVYSRYQPVNKDTGKPPGVTIQAANFVVNINQSEISKYIDVTPDQDK